jgi:hypothetical protein
MVRGSTAGRLLAGALSLALTVGVSGCKGADGLTGLDGSDGWAYTAVTWVAAPLALYMSDPGIPSTVVKDRFYRSQPGIYQLAYTAWDGSRWSASYTIEIMPGERGEPGAPGGWFWKKGTAGANGADGPNLYYTLRLYSSGPDLGVSHNPLESAVLAASEVERVMGSSVTATGTQVEVERRATLWLAPGAEPVEELRYRQGDWLITLRYWRSPV